MEGLGWKDKAYMEKIIMNEKLIRNEKSIID